MTITILSVGKIKEKYLLDAIAEYSKRLTKYCKLEMVSVADEKTPQNASERDESIIKDTEGQRILSHIKDSDHVIALAIDGKQYDSVEFSQLLCNHELASVKRLVLIIGGSLGLSDEVLKRSDEKISFSRMTFPHQLMRVILLEQIYRAYRIKNNEPYHK